MLVLLIDDDAATCQVLAEALETAGHLVVSASDGQDALDQLHWL
jgi:CheY-like chemotaxis protein